MTGPPSSGDPDRRRAQVRAGLDRTRKRIVEACLACGRDPGEITLVVVTKTYPVTDVDLLIDLDVHDIGESRDQEAAAKHAALGQLRLGRPDPHLTWHFIGRLQSNKARHVASYADVVHSVDRLSVVEPLGRGAHESARTVACLVQVSLDGDPSRGGALTRDVPALADAIAAQGGLVVAGVMAVAPVGVDPRRAFEILATVGERLRSTHPRATVMSAGMSGDLEAAVTVGATHLRVGTAVLGARSPLG